MYHTVSGYIRPAHCCYFHARCQHGGSCEACLQARRKNSCLIPFLPRAEMAGATTDTAASSAAIPERPLHERTRRSQATV